MGVGVDGEGDAELFAELDGGGIEVEAVGVGVDFHGDVVGSESGIADRPRPGPEGPGYKKQRLSEPECPGLT